MNRIAYVLSPAYEGGAERYLLRLSAGLDRGSFHPVWVMPARPELDTLAARAGDLSIDVVRHVPGNLVGAIRRARPNLVHLNMPSAYDLASGGLALTARAAGASRVVTTEHIVDIAPSRRRGLLKRAVLPLINRVIAISGAHRDILVERHGVPAGKIRVIRNGVEDPGTGAPRPGGSVRIVCVGSLELRKGQDVLIDAMDLLRADGVEAELVLVGDGPDRGALTEQVRSRNLQSRVTFTGRVESAWPAFRDSHIVAAPSRREGIPFTVLEALAAGRPVVATNLPGMTEVIEDGISGYLVPPDDARILADRLARLVASAGERESLGSKARGVYESRFTLERMIRETEALYREVSA